MPAISHPKMEGSFSLEMSFPARKARITAARSRTIDRIIFQSPFPQYRTA